MQIDAPEVHMPEATSESVLGGRVLPQLVMTTPIPFPRPTKAPADSAASAQQPADQPAKSEDRHVGDGQ